MVGGSPAAGASSAAAGSCAFLARERLGRGFASPSSAALARVRFGLAAVAASPSVGEASGAGEDGCRAGSGVVMAGAAGLDPALEQFLADVALVGVDGVVG